MQDLKVASGSPAFVKSLEWVPCFQININFLKERLKSLVAELKAEYAILGNHRSN